MDWLEKGNEWCVFAKATNILQQLADKQKAEREQERLEYKEWRERNWRARQPRNLRAY